MAVPLLLIIVAGIGESFSWHYKRLILSRLPALSAKATDSLYDVTVQDIRINIFTRAVTVHGLRMSANLDVLQRRRDEGRPPHVVLDVTVPEAHITGVKWNDLAAEKSLSCRSVHFYKPEIRVQIMPEWEQPDGPRPRHTPTINQVSAQRIAIDDPQFDVRYGYGEGAFSVQTGGGYIRARDWHFYPHHRFDATRFFGAASADISLTNATYTYPGTLYRYTMRGIRFNTQDSSGAISGLHIAPAMSYEAFYNIVGHRRNIYECYLPEVQVHGLAWRTLLAQHALNMERMDLANADLAIYLSKRPPVAEHMHPAYFPQQWLQRVTLPLNIRNINLWDGSVRYSETNAKTGETGTLLFNYLRGGIYNVTNRADVITKMPVCRSYMSAKFMYKTDMAAIIDLALNGKRGGFAINGRVRNLDAEQIRAPVQAMAIANVASLHIPDATVHIAGNADSSWGRFAIQYHALRVKLQKWNAGDSDVHSRVLLSFLANKILLYRDNPMPGEGLRTVTTGVARGQVRSLFLLVWKNIFQACTLTAIRDEGALDMVKRRAANKGKPKQKFFKNLFPKRR